MIVSRSVSPSSLTTVIDDFLPNGGFVSTTSTVLAGLVAQGIVGLDRRLASVVVRADAVEEQVHRAQARDAVAPVRRRAARRSGGAFFWPFVELVVAARRSRGGEQEAAGAAGRVGDDLARLRAARSPRWPR